MKRLASGNQPRASSALVDYRGGHSFFEIVCARRSAAVDQPRAAHVAICHLVAAKVDGMIAVQVSVNALVEFSVAGIAHVERRVAAVIFLQLLLVDVGLHGYAEMIGLAVPLRGKI